MDVSAIDKNFASLGLGDKLVGYISAWDLLGEGDRDCCMVDNTHPNDLGAMRMANTLYPIVKKMLDL